MEIEAYRDLSGRWSNLEEDYAKLQSETEEQAEQSMQAHEGHVLQVRYPILLLQLFGNE